MTRPFANAVAAVSPIVVLVLALLWLGRKEPWVAAPDVVTQDHALASSPPDIVILGNSLAAADVNRPALSAALSMGPAVALTENASSAPTWYAMLKFRVAEGNYHPKLILIVNSLTAMLRPTPNGPADMALMKQHFSEPDAVLSTKVLGGSPTPWLDRVQDRRTHLHQDGLDALRTLVAGPDAQTVLGGIFTNENNRSTEQHAVGPIIEREREDSAGVGVGWDASVMPDIVSLGKELGAQVVFVRVPIARSQPRYDDVPSATEAEVITQLNDAGAGWIDLRSLTDSEADFSDGRHMNARGRQRLTALLAEKLVEIGATGRTRMAASLLPVLPTHVTRSPAPPPLVSGGARTIKPPCGFILPWGTFGFLAQNALQARGHRVPSPLIVRQDGVPLAFLTNMDDLGPECHGAYGPGGNGMRFSGRRATGQFDLALTPDFPLMYRGVATWWLYPETSAEAAFSGAWKAPEFSVSATIAPVGEGTPPTLTAGDTRVPFTLDADGMLRAELVTGPPTADWRTTIETPAGGSFGILKQWLVGKDEAKVAVVETVSKVVSLFSQTFTCSDPPPLADPGPPNDGPIPWFTVPDLEWLARKEVAELAGDRGSSPVLVTQDGAILPRGALQDLQAGKAGITNHFADKLQFRPTDGRLEHAWGIALDPHRTVKHGRWVYPGETCEVTIIPKNLRTQVRTIMVSAAAGQPPPEGATLRVTLTTGDQTLVDDVVDWVAAVDGQSWRLPNEDVPALTLKLVASADLPISFLKLLAVGDTPTSTAIAPDVGGE